MIILSYPNDQILNGFKMSWTARISGNPSEILQATSHTTTTSKRKHLGW